MNVFSLNLLHYDVVSPLFLEGGREGCNHQIVVIRS